MLKTFILSDGSVNSYGFRVLTSGIDIEDFLKNPLMLWNHNRSYRDDENTILPIGRWVNVRIEGDKLLADAEFDMDDAFAAKISKKVDKGVISACSIGFERVEETDEPEFILPGQRRFTVSKCKLKECSITDLGSNKNAIALYDKDGQIIELTDDDTTYLPTILSEPTNTDIENENNQINLNMKLIALKLGLPESATEAEILNKISELNDKAAQVALKETEIQSLKDAQTATEKAAIEGAVNDAIVAKKLSADQKTHFVQLGEKTGIESLKVTLSALQPAVKPTDLLNQGAGGAPAGGKKFSELNSEELVALRSSDMPGYVKLFEGEFGFKPEIQ